MLFRDESEKVSEKCQKIEVAKMKKRAAERKRRPRSCDCEELVPSNAYLETERSRSTSPIDSLQLIWSLRQPVQEVSDTYFLGVFIKGSRFSYLSNLYRANDFDDPLSHVVRATSLASLSIETNRGELMHAAREIYAKALTVTNNALRSPELSNKDEVLAAVMLLAFFETLTYEKQSSLKHWNAHTNGAMSLVALRGPQLFESELGLQLFAQLGSNIILSCLNQWERIPPELCKLGRQARQGRQLPYPLNTGWLADLSVTIKFADLNASIVDGTLTDPIEIILQAQALEKELEDVARDVPNTHGYKTMSNDTSSPWVYGRQYLLTPDQFVAKFWTNVWMARMLTSEIIHFYASQLRETQKEDAMSNLCLTSLISTAERNTIEVTGLICDMVPQFLPCFDCKEVNPEIRTASAGYFVIWPLYCASIRHLGSPKVRDYAIKVLQYLYHDLKIPQAGNIAQMLKDDRTFEDWLHMYHVF